MSERPDFRSGGRDAEDDKADAAIALEHALLGILLYDNSALEMMPDGLTGASFIEPVHGAMYDTIAATIREGMLAEPVTLHSEFMVNPAYEKLGGISYLADLVDRAPAAASSGDYGAAIVELAAKREIVRLAGELMTKARSGQGKASELIEEAEKRFLKLEVRGKQADFIPIRDAVDHVLAYVDDRSTPPGVSTGLAPVDLAMGSMMPGTLILGAGRPSMGKSAVGLAFALNVAAPELAARMNHRDLPWGAKPKGVIQLHAEMGYGEHKDGGGQTLRRHFSDVGYAIYGERFPTYRAIRDKKVEVDQREMMAEVAELLRSMPITGIKQTGLTVSRIRSKLRRQIALWHRMGIETAMALVDHVGLIRTDERMGRYEAQTEIAIGLQELASELGITILALIQLSRNVEQRPDKRPQLSDLRDSGAWEENADVVMTIYRDAYYATKEQAPDQDRDFEKYVDWDRRRRSKEIELGFPKVREGDSSGVAKVWADLPHNAIRGEDPDGRLVRGLLL